MLLAGKDDDRHCERNEVESRNPVSLWKVISAGSFDFAQDDVAWKLVKLKT